jgi:Protein of unknown function (DUF3433)
LHHLSYSRLIFAGDVNEKEWKKKSQDGRPLVFYTWMGPLLLIALLALMSAIVTLFVISRRGGLRQQALVREFEITFADTVTQLAPYSIVPTLFAVGVKLWYGAIEESLRSLQPFLAMAVRPAPISRSLLLEYANAPLAFMSFKAAKNSHYMLALVGLGALGTEICEFISVWHRLRNYQSSFPSLWTQTIAFSSDHLLDVNHVEITDTF